MRRLHPSSVVLAVFPPGKDGEGSVKMHEGAMIDDLVFGLLTLVCVVLASRAGRRTR